MTRNGGPRAAVLFRVANQRDPIRSYFVLHCCLTRQPSAGIL